MIIYIWLYITTIIAIIIITTITGAFYIGLLDGLLGVAGMIMNY